MAITAAITLSSATSTAPGQVTATCTVTNNNSTNANVTGVFPKASVTATNPQSVAVQLGLPALGPGFTTLVLASGGTLAIPFAVQAFAPFQGGPSPGNPSSVIYDIGADVYTNATGSDALVAASTTTLTVSAPSSH